MGNLLWLAHADPEGGLVKIVDYVHILIMKIVAAL